MVDPKDCLFCRIVQGEIPSKKVYEDSGALAFLDINPRNPGHTLVIPKRHAETIFDLPEAEAARLFPAVKKVAAMVKSGMQAQGISICQNNGSAAGQVVGHLYVHVIPRFLSEGPPALENMLPIKKMDEKALDKIAASIKGAPATGARLEEPPRAAEKPAAPAEERRQKPASDDEESGDFEEIDFNF
ncbi:MAG: HIT family protein [Candidatus Aenigmarchaeota archaeon]|nr:HIT family protein [Candidatus Aenigmarchaeota archaeon]